jgi:eukaryotic-like serine/threonine-protein kinase
MARSRRWSAVSRSLRQRRAASGAATTSTTRGECDKREADARREIALEPDGAEGYENLALALASRGAPAESIGEAFRKKDEHRGDVRSGGQDSAEDMARLAVYVGDFTHALELLDEVDKASANRAGRIAHSTGTIRLARIYLEMGDTARAADAVEAYARRASAWLRDDPGGDLRILAMRRNLGTLSPAEYRSARDAIVKERRAFAPASTWGDLWVAAYAQGARDAADANEALAVLAGDPADLSRVQAAWFRGAIARVYLYANRTDEAIAEFRREARSCLMLDGVAMQVDYIHDRALIGQALEQKGDKPGACDAYAYVLSRWGHAKPRSVTAEKTRERANALGCAL